MIQQSHHLLDRIRQPHKRRRCPVITPAVVIPSKSE